MTLPEFLAWQAYARHKAKAAAAPGAPALAADTGELPALTDLGPGDIARAIGAR